MKQQKYSIAQVSDLLGYKPYVIRYYEKVFNLNIPRDDLNRRYFTEKEILIFNQIKELQKRGYNNKQIKMIINSSETYTQQIYEQIEGIAATAYDIKPLCSYDTINPILENVIKGNTNNTAIEELNKQLESINRNITIAISILMKISKDISRYNENSYRLKNINYEQFLKKDN